VLLAAIFVATAVVFGGLAVRRIARERDRAEAMRAMAESQRSVAVVQRDAAERLVAALVGDLREKLVPMGRLDVLSSLGEKILDYYRSVEPTEAEIDAPTLLRRAKAIATIAGVYEVQHTPKEALSSYETAIALCERAAALAPDDAQPDLDRSWYLYRIGVTELNSGHVSASLAGLDRSFEALTAATKRKGSQGRERELANRRAQVLNSMAVTLKDSGALERAYAVTTEAKGILASELAKTPEDEALRKSIAWSYFHRAGIGLKLGELTQAAADARSCRDLRTGLAAGSPDDQYRKLDLAWAHLRMGVIEDRQEKQGDARESLSLARTLFDALVRAAPDQFQFRDARADALLAACNVERHAKRYDDARARCDESRATYEELAKGGRDPAAWDSVTRAYAAMSEIESDVGVGARARALAERAVEASARASEAATGDAKHDEPRADARLARGRALLTSAPGDEAIRAASEARDIWALLAYESPADAERAARLHEAELLLARAQARGPFPDPTMSTSPHRP
jgi:tetratricopeptide (TPR) repeat protein